jgi:hypothetical protein
VIAGKYTSLLVAYDKNDEVIDKIVLNTCAAYNFTSYKAMTQVKRVNVIADGNFARLLIHVTK